MDDFVLDLLRWETHTRPGIGQSAQDVINPQIGDDYDIFLGMFGIRFGTPTREWQSGTEEEFRRALSRFKRSDPIREHLKNLSLSA